MIITFFYWKQKNKLKPSPLSKPNIFYRTNTITNKALEKKYESGMDSGKTIQYFSLTIANKWINLYRS